MCPSLSRLGPRSFCYHDHSDSPSSPSLCPCRTYKGRAYVFGVTPFYKVNIAYILKVDWANLAAIDLSQAKTLEGRKSLVKQVHDAIKNDGFLFVVNHGVKPEQVSFNCSVLEPSEMTTFRFLGCSTSLITP
jgi:hypothetical protein